ncbi:MAG TPA: AsmA-like C-terminal region-containing protein, partial [Roseimicrobium sp.]|nr:AsmA-like C-terminal region-containing protein [Roseimicrobium sp.]
LFSAHVLSAIDPMLIKPLFTEPKTVKVLNDFTFHQPPRLDLKVSGAWNDVKQLKASGPVIVRDAVYRGNWASNVTATIHYTDRFIGVTKALMVHDGRELRSSGLSLDLKAQHIWITNAVSDVDPLVVTRFIGPQTTRAVEPYKFATPPHVILHGSLPFRGADLTDLHFEVEGGPFQYWKFNLPHIKASVHWVTNFLSITNVVGDFHQGRLRGEALFDFRPEKNADFRFHAIASEADFHSLMSDLSTPTNKLEGTLNVELTVTSANTADWGSWQGYGYAQLLDGYLWDIPLVGMLSPVLDSMVTGLGRSRISEGLMTYQMTNSVIRTKDLELKGNSMRLQYGGTCDFAGNVDARVEAELFRDSNMVGRVFGYVLTPITKLLEYKVTGTLGRPKMEPLFIPKFLFFPLQPFKTMKDLFESDKPEPPKAPAPSPAQPKESPPPPAPK